LLVEAERNIDGGNIYRMNLGKLRSHLPKQISKISSANSGWPSINSITT